MAMRTRNLQVSVIPLMSIGTITVSKQALLSFHLRHKMKCMVVFYS